MKNGWIAALVVPAFAFICNKQNGAEWLEGKVLRTSCASFVVQVTNNNNLGQDGWKDMTNNDAAYDNVFNAGNKCAIPSNIKAGDAIKFKIDKPMPNNCVICMMFDGPPQVQYDIRDITVVDAK